MDNQKSNQTESDETKLTQTEPDKPESAEPESAEPELVEPELSKPELIKTESNEPKPELNETEPTKPELPETNAQQEKAKSTEHKKHSATPWIITSILLLICAAAGACYVKFSIIDQKDSEISTLEAEKALQESVISKLGVDLEEYTKNLAEANTELEKTADTLTNTNSMLNFLLDESAEALVDKYLSRYGTAINVYNPFTQGIYNADYRFYLALINTTRDYGDYEDNGTYYYTVKYTNINETYKDLFGSSNNLPTKSPSTILDSSILKIEYDESLYDSIGGFKISYTYYNGYYSYYSRETFLYGTKDYYVNENGFSIDVYVAFAKPRNDGSYGYKITLTDDTSIDWGGYSCVTTGSDFIEKHKDELPIYTMNFSQDNGQYVLDSIKLKA